MNLLSFQLRQHVVTCCWFLLLPMLTSYGQTNKTDQLLINDLEYLEMPGLNVMLAHDFYPEGHQGGVGFIQNGLRVATNGDLRLEPTPGQWQPVPKVGTRMVDRNNQEISIRMEYPDPDKNGKGFNPIFYPNVHFSYIVKIKPEGKSFRVIVDLDKPLPDEWIGKVGFNLELYPGILFGKSYRLDNTFGIFPRQPNGPGYEDADGEYQILPLAEGKTLTIAPESEQQRMTIENIRNDKLQLIDGRGKHNNGWFVVRSLVASGATRNAIEWRITPNAIPGWMHSPVVQVSQVGYHPKQQKVAVIELDAADNAHRSVKLQRITEKGLETELEDKPEVWGKFLRYNYLRFDFSTVEKPGMYLVAYGDYKTQPFQISERVFKRHVWQPTIEYFLPAQMCHMRVNENYRVWHGLCHMDDARMAPVDTNHFDGYLQGASTLTSFKPGDAVSGLNQGAWHDAGDFDIRIESQATTVHMLSLMYEQFNTEYDNTTIDQDNKVVEIQRPDGKNDFLQQIEHGALSIVGGYHSLGRFYRGIICPTLRQYVLLGDAVNMTDNQVFDGSIGATGKVPPVGLPGSPDDRWVFTEDNPRRELDAAAALAAAARALKNYDKYLADECLAIALETWTITKEKDPLHRLKLATELLITTKEKKYADFLVSITDKITAGIERTGWIVGPTIQLVNNKEYTESILKAVAAYRRKVDEQERKNPYGVPYEPNIWGAGWGIQHFGVEQYFLHTYYPDIFGPGFMLHAMNFVLGCHPGTNTASFVSGVGSRSLTTAYGFNRADWSYIPGGIGSGTALIRPDFPEMLDFPFLWQQTEYVLGGGTTDFLFLIFAADKILDK